MFNQPIKFLVYRPFSKTAVDKLHYPIKSKFFINEKVFISNKFYN